MMGILNFEPKICRKMYIYVNLMHLFIWLSGFQLVADQVIFDIGWVVDKACIYTMNGQ